MPINASALQQLLCERLCEDVRLKPPMYMAVASVRLNRLQWPEGGLDGIPHPLGSTSANGELFLYVNEGYAIGASLKSDG